MAERSKIEIALELAAEKIIGAVADSFTESAVAGSQGVVGATGAAAGQSSQTTQTGSAHKNDVSVPEGMESLNLHVVKDANIANKMLVDSYGARTAANSKLLDITETALGMLTMGSAHNQSLHQQMGTDHRDQNHDRQINVNETDALATVLTSAVVERLRNPTPQEDSK